MDPVSLAYTLQQTTVALPKLDPNLYPKTYKPSIGQKIFFFALGLPMTLGGIALIAYFGSPMGKDENGAGAGAGLGLFFALLGALLIVTILRSKTVLTADAIEVFSLLGSKKLRRSEIVGLRLSGNQQQKMMELCPRDKSRRIAFALNFRADAAFDSWFAGMTNLDAVEKAEFEAQIAQNADYGLTTEERAVNCGRARAIAKGLNYVSCAVVLWALWFPQPYALAIAVLASLPLLSVVLTVRSNGLYQLTGLRNDVRPTLTAPFMSAGLLLAIRAFLDMHFLEWTVILTAAIVAGAAISRVVFSADGQLRGRRAAVGAMFVLAAAYSFGALAEMNMLLDHSAPKTYEAEVLNKYISGGKVISKNLDVAPWGPEGMAGEVSVATSVYDAVQPGDTVCMDVMAGALRIPWYFVSPCR